MHPKLVMFGDSITEYSFDEGGWGAALAHHFRRKCDVVLRGYSGYNTRWALKVLERVFDGLEGGSPVVAVTVFFGANDATLPDRAGGFQHVPVHEYMANLKAIVSFLKERWPMAVVLLITPPPIDEDGRINDGLHLTPEGCKVVVEEVVEKLKENGVDMEVMSLDLPLFVDIDPNDPFKGF